MTFNEFNLNEQLHESISYMGFEKATPVQEQAIPIIMKNKDLIACAQTGTGKTAAFLIPIIQHMLDKGLKGTNTLILVPTRELAVQTDQQIQGIGYFADISSRAVYGGGDGEEYEAERRALTNGANIIVATPGKLISHLAMGNADFSNIKHLVLDEADRMLDIGFHDDIIKIISHLPKERQTMMFSATMPPKIRSLSKKILREPEEFNIALSKPAEGVLQAAYMVHDKQKTALLNSLIKDNPEYNSILIFSSTKKKVGDIVASLKRSHEQVQGISSDFEQKEREEVLNKFKAKKTRILVATDVLSRGIDIKDINLIINFDVPQDAEDYVHRVGRTARAETTGVALTFINEDDIFRFQRIEKLIETSVQKLTPPAELGAPPVWKDYKPGQGGKRKHFSKKGKGGKKPFHKGKKRPGR